MLHSDNAYFIPNMKVTGRVCRTHFQPHTAFRGFGGPQGVAMIERIIEEMAVYLNKDPLDIRKINLYRAEGGRDITHYGQKVENNQLTTLFERLEKSSDYRLRRRQIEEHNQNAAKTGEALRGISLTPVKFGISFTTRFLNQANALVIVHRDGTLQVGTGATEMGQGVNARIAEMVARELGIARHQVRMLPTSTDRNANTSPTAASSGTDLNGGAAVLATRRIKKRLSQVAVQLAKIAPERWASKTAGLGTEAEILVKNLSADLNDPNEGAEWTSGVATYDGVEFSEGRVRYPGLGSTGSLSLAELVNEAYLNRISLTEYAHYRFQNLNFNKIEGQGRAFLYFTQGTACSDVSVDQQTGEVKVLRADILMDLGRPVNEALDVSQVTGGFVQGMGWVTTEKLYYNAQGALLSHAPSTYKIPNIQDIPREFHVELLSNEENTANVRGTKAVGEPPLLLCLSVWTAIADAVKHAPEAEVKLPRLEIPATQEECLRAMQPARFRAWSQK